MVAPKTKERGATLLLVTFVSAFFLIPIIGTCIDGAILYWVKARLSSAVDAAALATGRSLNVGQTSADQLANATATGQRYFAANFPPGIMRTSLVGGAPTITIDESILRKRVVTVTASVTVPLFFMRIIGFSNSTVASSGQSTRWDSNIMLVLDRSGSMNNSSGSCSALVASAQNFVSQFVDGRDRLGLVTFQTGANVDYAPTLTFKSGSTTLNSVLGSLKCGGDTNTGQGMYLAFDQIKNVINQPGALNAIVLFTDGQPNTITANFAVKKSVDNRYSPTNTSKTVSTPVSGCSGSTLTGAIADGSNETATDVMSLNATGGTYAVFKAPSVSISTTTTSLNAITASGCSFPSNGITYGRVDIEAIPSTDAWGNSTTGYLALDPFPTGNPYVGKIRPDEPRNVRWAAFNTVDSQALTIRNNTTYGTVIYTIGLQGNESMSMDQDFMERVANDPQASNYDATRPQGQFFLVTDNASMSQAFQQIASQILRLSR